jgi:hypothetical protein
MAFSLISAIPRALCRTAAAVPPFATAPWTFMLEVRKRTTLHAYGAPSSWLGRQTSGVVVSLILYAPPKPAFAMLRLLSSSSGIMSLISPSNNYGPWLSRLMRVLIKSMPIVTGMRTVGVLELKPWLPRAPV